MTQSPSPRLVFLGSPPFAVRCFEHLCTTRYRPLLLVTQPDKEQGRGRKVAANPLADVATAHGVERLECPDAAAPEFLEKLRSLDPDWILVVSFGQILRKAFLALPKHGVLNVHASLLPRWRGASPIAAAIRAGDATTGLTIQRVVPKLDAGPVCARQELPIPPHATTAELQSLLAEEAGPLLERTLDELYAGRASFVEQDPAQVTLAPKIAKNDGRIDWEQGAEEIDRHVRAMTPWPGASTGLPIREALTKVRVLRGAPSPVTSAAEPGTVIGAEECGIDVACGSARAYRVLELQVVNGKAMEVGAFLRGRRVEVGSRAESASQAS
ncbi:MAG: methionyl-tRNA formyltransferase [Planctomycetes bacterium]|nr:methionyl-tRNA formyltransferase [Planctomycetota bacterium]